MIFFVYRTTFDECQANLSKVLQRCEESNLVLNWEKYHFMVMEGVVLGHLVSKKGIEVDKAKFEIIKKMQHQSRVCEAFWDMQASTKDLLKIFPK